MKLRDVSNRKERRGRKEAHSAIGYVLFVLSAVENGSKMKREAMHPQITRIAQMLRTKTPGWLGSGCPIICQLSAKLIDFIRRARSNLI